MAIFNPEYFTNPAGSLNTAFGIPTCITELTVTALSFLSNGLLSTLSDSVSTGKKNARSNIADMINEQFELFGVLSYDSASGKLDFLSESSRHGIDLSWGSKAAEITGWLSEAESLYGQGEDIYDGIVNCIKALKDNDDTTGPSPVVGAGGLGGGSTTAYVSNYQAAQLAISKAKVVTCFEFIDNCNKTLTNIGKVLQDRQEAEAEAAETEESTIFRLLYGPPVSKQGVFILSEDGLYYDSQTRDYNGQDIPSPSDIGVVLASDAWNINRPPNLGGRGDVITLDDVNQYVNTLFDLNQIDEKITSYYDNDHFLETMFAQKQKMVLDTSAQVNELIVSGYSPDSALVINHKQSILAVISSFNYMINKRKKQIEVAVRAPTLFGTSTIFEPGEIPINDFSYLSGVNINVTLEQQERLVFESGSIDDVVLPIKPLFVRSYGSQSARLSLPFSVAEIGKGSIILGGSVSSAGIPTLSITDSVVSDHLFGIYNFLKPAGVSPDSTSYTSLNCATLGIKENAQLIGRNEQLFLSGLGIPRFTGMTSLVDGSIPKINNYGSVVRLPETEEFQNYMYGPNGATFECWLHMPGYGSSSNYYERGESSIINHNPENAAWGDYNYYKLILANENVGGHTDYTVSTLIRYQGTNTVKGMLLGFSRDPVITASSLIIPGTNTDPGLNAGISVADTAGSGCFFIAPTMSLDSGQATFIPSKTDCISESFAKLTVDDRLSVNGLTFRDVSSGFHHLVTSFDVSANECRVYLDTQLMAVSGLSDVFGTELHKAPRVPTFISSKSSTSSFEYTAASVDQNIGIEYFNTGPHNGLNFTPWILGGGWTDGMPITPITLEGGFMGKRHGISSGLGGHLGSVKFYSKPLSTKEVLDNYNAQKGFYTNIVT